MIKSKTENTSVQKIIHNANIEVAQNDGITQSNIEEKYNLNARQREFLKTLQSGYPDILSKVGIGTSK